MNVFDMSFENMYPFSFVFTLAAMMSFICMFPSYMLNHGHPLSTCVITVGANLHHTSSHALYPSVYLVNVAVQTRLPIGLKSIFCNMLFKL